MKRNDTKTELPGRRKGKRPKKRFLGVLKGDYQLVGVKEEDAGDRVRRKQVIYCGDS